MAAPASTYGLDVRCVSDADAFFSSATGIDVVYQNAIHRITTDDIPGDDGTGSLVIVGWGFDCRRLLGMSASKLASYQPVIAEAMTRDDRIDTADVTLTPTKDAYGNADVLIQVKGDSAFGPFSFVKSVRELTAADFIGSPT